MTANHLPAKDRTAPRHWDTAIAIGSPPNAISTNPSTCDRTHY